MNSSEHVAIQQLLASVPATGGWLVLSNIGLPDRGHAWPGDIDIVLIGSDTVHYLEVKPWEANFLANPDNRTMIDDARRRTKAKSGYLHRLIARRYPHLNHRTTILVSNAGISQTRPASCIDGSLATGRPQRAGDIIDPDQCARLFDADARPTLSPAELNQIATLMDAAFDPSRCLIAGPPATSRVPKEVVLLFAPEGTNACSPVVRRVRGAPITPYVPPALAMPPTTDPSPVQTVIQVPARVTRRRKAGTEDMPRKPGLRGARIVGYLPRTSGTTVESAPLVADQPPATNWAYRGKTARRTAGSSPLRNTARRRRADIVPYGRS